MPTELLTPFYWSIGTLFKYRFRVPVYQRPYSWTTTEVNSLIDDIMNSYIAYKNMPEEQQQVYSFYVGNIILHKKEHELYDIIDGQQRITTFSLILLACYTRLNELDVDPNDRILINIQSSLWKLNNEERPVLNRRVIELGSIDKQSLIEVFNAAYSQPKELKQFINSYSFNSNYEENIKNNFNKIHEFIKNEFYNKLNELRELLLFTNFILKKVSLIAIINEENDLKAFSIFESINSKGKRLDDIDLIKTRIFSHLSEADYPLYSSLWGKLIIETSDQLYDYLMIYIKANIKFYNGNITYNNFISLDDKLCSYFRTTSIPEAYKKLIDDMINKVDLFKATIDLNSALNVIDNNQFNLYYAIYTKIGYKHPRALFFRCFSEYKNEHDRNRITKDDLIEIVIETIKSSMIFLTICGKDSKDEIIIFKDILEHVYEEKRINKGFVISKIKALISNSGLRYSDIISSLENLDVFESNKYLGAAIASAYESKYQSGNEEKISWDEAYSKLTTYGHLTLDHILVQTPSANDINLKYYELGKKLTLKEGHDFPLDKIHEGMEYDEFKSAILHKAGNLRLRGGDGNSSHSNSSDPKFCTYRQLEDRNKKVCEFFVNNVLKLTPITYQVINNQTSTGKRRKLSGNFDLSTANLDLTGTKPQTITIVGKTKHIRYLRDIIINLCIFAYEKDSAKLIQIAQDKWQPASRFIITNDKSIMNQGYEIVQNQIYLETNLSARDIINYSRKLCEEFEIDKSKVLIYIPE